MSRLRRPFLSDRYFFITVRLLQRRVKMTDGDFAMLAQAFNRARARHPLLLTAWVFFPDHWHAICAPRYPETVSRVVKFVKQGSTMAINHRRAASGEVWQARFSDRALRTVKEYNEKIEYLRPNPLRAGLVQRGWRRHLVWSVCDLAEREFLIAVHTHRSIAIIEASSM